jgi:bifunctional non-homologous end joining protein LigD
VAVPIAWDELGKVKAGNEWTAERVLRRVRTLRDDPWADFWTTGERQELPAGER